MSKRKEREKRRKREFLPFPRAVAIHWSVFSAYVLKFLLGARKSPVLGITAGASQSLLLKSSPSLVDIDTELGHANTI